MYRQTDLLKKFKKTWWFFIWEMTRGKGFFMFFFRLKGDLNTWNYRLCCENQRLKTFWGPFPDKNPGKLWETELPAASSDIDQDHPLVNQICPCFFTKRGIFQYGLTMFNQPIWSSNIIHIDPHLAPWAPTPSGGCPAAHDLVYHQSALLSAIHEMNCGMVVRGRLIMSLWVS